MPSRLRVGGARRRGGHDVLAAEVIGAEHDGDVDALDELGHLREFDFAEQSVGLFGLRAVELVVHVDVGACLRGAVEVDRQHVAAEEHDRLDRLLHLRLVAGRSLEAEHEAGQRRRHRGRRDAGEHEHGFGPVELLDVEAVRVDVGSGRVGRQAARPNGSGEQLRHQRLEGGDRQRDQRGRSVHRHRRLALAGTDRRGDRRPERLEVRAAHSLLLARVARGQHLHGLVGRQRPLPRGEDRLDDPARVAEHVVGKVDADRRQRQEQRGGFLRSGDRPEVQGDRQRALHSQCETIRTTVDEGLLQRDALIAGPRRGVRVDGHRDDAAAGVVVRAEHEDRGAGEHAVGVERGEEAGRRTGQRLHRQVADRALRRLVVLQRQRAADEHRRDRDDGEHVEADHQPGATLAPSLDRRHANAWAANRPRRSMTSRTGSVTK